jgi:toxin CcdB
MIRQFDVCRNPSRSGRADRPFVLVVQADQLSVLPTRIAAPLALTGAIKPEGRMNPRFEIAGVACYFSPTEIRVFPMPTLGKPIANLEDYRYQIVSALDLVFLGI